MLEEAPEINPKSESEICAVWLIKLNLSTTESKASAPFVTEARYVTSKASLYSYD